jgi:hypothetical protein
MTNEGDRLLALHKEIDYHREMIKKLKEEAQVIIDHAPMPHMVMVDPQPKNEPNQKRLDDAVPSSEKPPAPEGAGKKPAKGRRKKASSEPAREPGVPPPAPAPTPDEIPSLLDGMENDDKNKKVQLKRDGKE